jgi:hypothetical protein
MKRLFCFAFVAAFVTLALKQAKNGACRSAANGLGR